MTEVIEKQVSEFFQLFFYIIFNLSKNDKIINQIANKKDKKSKTALSLFDTQH